MNELQLKIIIRAVRIRLANGENIETILDSYPKLTAAERVMIEETVKGDGNAN